MLYIHNFFLWTYTVTCLQVPTVIRSHIQSSQDGSWQGWCPRSSPWATCICSWPFPSLLKCHLTAASRTDCSADSREPPCHHLSVLIHTPFGEAQASPPQGGLGHSQTACSLHSPIPPATLHPGSATHGGNHHLFFLFLTRTWMLEAILRAMPNFLQWCFAATWFICV